MIEWRALQRWLEDNIDALVAGTAVYRGMRVSVGSEVVTYHLAFSVIVASFCIPSQMLIVGQPRVRLWQAIYSFGTFIFGWWGFPYGPIYTVQSLHGNWKSSHRRYLGNLLAIPGWDGGGGSFAGMLPKG